MDINKRISVATRIYFAAKEACAYSYYFTNGESPIEQEYLANSSHLRFISHSLWRVSITETSKLVAKSRNQRFNLFLIIEELKKNKYEFEHKELMLDKWVNSLAYIEYEIEIVKRLRDKIYAHTDDEVLVPGIKFDYNDVTNVHNRLWNLIFDLNLYVLDKHFEHSLPYFEGQRLDLLTVLAENKRKRMDELMKKQ